MRPTIGEVLERACAALAAGESAAAMLLARHVLASYPRHIGAHDVLARALHAQGQHALAEDLLIRVVSADPTRVAAHLALARCLAAKGTREAALRAALIAREEAPDDPDAVALVEHLAGAQLADLWPSRGWLARRYLHLTLYHRALAEASALLAADPARLDLRVIAALALWRMGESAQAYAAAVALLDDASDCLPGLLLAAVCASAREAARADELWAQARQLDPEDRVAQALLGDDVALPPRPPVDLPPPPAAAWQAAAQRESESAELRRLSALVGRGEGGPSARLALAALYSRRGDVPAALAQYRALLRERDVALPALCAELAALAQTCNVPAAWSLLGDVYLRLGDLARAGAAYARGA